MGVNRRDLLRTGACVIGASADGRIVMAWRNALSNDQNGTTITAYVMAGTICPIATGTMSMI